MLRLSALTLSVALLAAPAFAHTMPTADDMSANDEMSAPAPAPMMTADATTDAYRGDPNAPAGVSGKAALGAARPIVVTEVVKPEEKDTKYVTQTTVVNPNQTATWANTPAAGTATTKVIVPAGSQVTIPAKGMPATTTIQVQ